MSASRVALLGHAAEDHAGLQLTLMSGTLYRLLRNQIGHGNQTRRASAKIRICEHYIDVAPVRRAHNPLPVVAGFREDRSAIPWLGSKQLHLVIGLEAPKSSHAEPWMKIEVRRSTSARIGRCGLCPPR